MEPGTVRPYPEQVGEALHDLNARLKPCQELLKFTRFSLRSVLVIALQLGEPLPFSHCRASLSRFLGQPIALLFERMPLTLR